MHLPQIILVATDFGPSSATAVETAFAMAARLNAQVHLAHVFMLRDVSASPLRTADEFEESELAARTAMDELVEKWRGTGLVGGTHVVSGEPAPCLAELAEELKSAWIVVGTHGRRGLKRALLGSVAESVVREAKCNVLVVKEGLAQTGA